MRKNLMLPSFLVALLLLGLIYSYLIQVDISNIKVVNSDHKQVDFTINSKIAQHIKLHVGTKDELNSLYCEEQKNNFTYYKSYHFKQQEEVTLQLKKGSNHCQLKTVRITSSLPLLKQKISFIDYFFLFIFFMVPLFHLLFTLFIAILNKIWNKKNV